MEKGAVYTGIYPNIFELAGYEKKEIENRIDQIFQTLFMGVMRKEFIIPSVVILDT